MDDATLRKVFEEGMRKSVENAGKDRPLFNEIGEPTLSVEEYLVQKALVLVNEEGSAVSVDAVLLHMRRLIETLPEELKARLRPT